MGRFMILPYKMQSEGAIALAEALDGLRIRLSNSEYRYREGDCIINWGNGDSTLMFGTLPEAAMLNPNVNICINKKLFFERMQGHNIVPPFAFSRDEAIRHLPLPILCRTRVEGADGAGAVIATTTDEVVNAPLYTQLLEKTGEYRVHLGRRFDGEIVLIAAQKKRLAADRPANPIWTGAQVFLDWCDPTNLPRPVFDVTKRSMELMPELHFGGFDVITTAANGARVVEVNSAPMMTPETTRKYAEFFKQYVEDRDEQARIDREELAMQQRHAEEDPTETPEYQQGYADCRREIENLMREFISSNLSSGR